MTIITPLCQRIFVRFRKPIWYPTAPSKLFRIPENTFYNEDEVRILRELFVAFRAQERSISEFMKHEFYLPAQQSGGLPTEFIQKEIEIDKQLREENDRENARVAELKKEYLNNRLKEMEEKLIEEKTLREQKYSQIAKKVDEYITRRIAETDSFVTPENIESKIENAINNPVSFEFFIDPRGKRYYTKPEQPKLGQPVNEVTGTAYRK